MYYCSNPNVRLVNTKPIDWVVLIFICCCCSYIPQVSADRDAISLNNYFKRIREKREEKKRKKLERQQAEYINPYDTSIKKKKRSAGDSLLVRSFMLACIFWVIKLSLPHLITWIAGKFAFVLFYQ